jgi:hypothetical protein
VETIEQQRGPLTTTDRSSAGKGAIGIASHTAIALHKVPEDWLILLT